MSKIISEEEVLTLHQFCVRHSVVHYDVRLELVDHLASSIEKIWEENPKVSFWDALNQVYATYGTTGFRKLMREKERAVEKSFNKGVWVALKSLLNWPQITILLSLIAVTYYFYGFFQSEDIRTPNYFIAIFCFFEFIFAITVEVILQRKNKKLAQPLLSTLIFSSFFIVHIFEFMLIDRFAILFFDKSVFYTNDVNPKTYILFAVIVIFVTMITIAKLIYGLNLFKKAKQTYPMAFK